MLVNPENGTGVFSSYPKFYNDNTDDDNATTPNAIKQFSTGVSFVYQIIYLVIGCFGLFSNLYVFVIIVLYKPMHRQITNIYIANQSLLDSVVSIMIIFSNIFQDDGAPHRYQISSVYDEALCQAWYSKMALWCAVEASTYSIVALTYDRYVAVVHPIWYKTQLSQKRWIVAISIAIIWLLVPVVSVGYNVPTSGITTDGACTDLVLYPSIAASQMTGVLVFLYEFLFPALLIIFGYARIAYVIHKRVKKTTVFADVGGQSHPVTPYGKQPHHMTPGSGNVTPRVLSGSGNAQPANVKSGNGNVQPANVKPGNGNGHHVTWSGNGPQTAVPLTGKTLIKVTEYKGEVRSDNDPPLLAAEASKEDVLKDDEVGRGELKRDGGRIGEGGGIVEGRGIGEGGISEQGGDGVATRCDSVLPAVGRGIQANKGMSKARNNVIKTSALVGFFFIFCWSWNEFYYLLFNLNQPMSYVEEHQFRDFTIAIGFINSCVNPIVYSVNYKLFRAGVKSVFRRLHLTQCHLVIVKNDSVGQVPDTTNSTSDF